MSLRGHTHDTKAIVCSHVVEEGLPVREVIHHENGGWQFLCGGSGHRSAETARLACMGCIVREDPSLAAITDLPEGTWASREMGDGGWSRYLLPDED